MWEKFSEELVFECNWFKIRKDEVMKPNGEKGAYYVMEKHPSVFIVPVQVAHPENFVYLIKQFRYATGKWSWELPAGSTDGNDPLESAKRELKEETGFEASTWDFNGTYEVAAGLSNNIGHIYIVTGLTQTDSNKQDEEGIVDCQKFTISQIKYMIKNGDISDGPTLAVLAKTILWQWG